MDDISNELEQIIDLPKSDRLLALLEHGRSISLRNINGAERNTVIEELVLLLNDGAGTGHQRRDLGVVLGRLGDRCVDQITTTIGSMSEWIMETAFKSDGPWCRLLNFRPGLMKVDTTMSRARTDSGIQWKQKWPVHVERFGHRSSCAPGDPQPSGSGCQLVRGTQHAQVHMEHAASNAERRWIVRGAEKRPYPWGQPFGDGNSNTREESLGQPCAVGLFLQDRTPDGVWDLAGNAAEWLRDGSDERRMLHPGS